jgi:hypothetical protein
MGLLSGKNSGSSSNGKIVGRAAKPGEAVNRKGIPVPKLKDGGTRVVGKSKPRQS